MRNYKKPINEHDVRKRLNDFRSGRIDSFKGLLKNVRERDRTIGANNNLWHQLWLQFCHCRVRMILFLLQSDHEWRCIDLWGYARTVL
jgi:hypothetical protein